MSKGDWVVLRMLKVAVKHKLTMRQFMETQRAMMYLRRKYGGKTLSKCIDLLNEEYA